MRSMVLSLFIFAALATTDAFALDDSSIYVNTGFNSGGLAFGVDYETQSMQSFGLGGFARYSQKNKDKFAHGALSIGGFARPHFMVKDRWDLYVSPGVAIAIIDNYSTNGDDETVFGPVYALGALFQTTPNVSMGLEDYHHFFWTGDKFRGGGIHEIMFKLRYIFN